MTLCLIVDVNTRNLFYHKCSRCRSKAEKVPASKFRPENQPATYYCSKCSIESTGTSGQFDAIYMLQFTVLPLGQLARNFISCLAFDKTVQTVIGIPAHDFYELCLYKPEVRPILRYCLVDNIIDLDFENKKALKRKLGELEQESDNEKKGSGLSMKKDFNFSSNLQEDLVVPSIKLLKSKHLLPLFRDPESNHHDR